MREIPAPKPNALTRYVNKQKRVISTTRICSPDLFAFAHGRALVYPSRPCYEDCPVPAGRTGAQQSNGEVDERFKSHAWKACLGEQPNAGSNPALSAKAVSEAVQISPEIPTSP